jgi:hypothetical protein
MKRMSNKKIEVEGIANGKTYIMSSIAMLGVFAVIITAIVMSMKSLETIIVKLNDNLITEEVSLTNKVMLGFLSTITTACIPTGFYLIKFIIKRYFNFRERKDYNGNRSTSSKSTKHTKHK